MKKITKALLFLTFIATKVVAQTESGIQTYYVSIDGKIENSGTMSAPFNSLGTALKKIKLTNSKDIIIYMRKGDYELTEAIKLSPETVGKIGSLIISGYGNEKVTISGGHRLKNSNFHKVLDPAILERLPNAARSKVKVLDLNTEGIKNYGTMKNYGFKQAKVPVRMELFYNNMPLTPARWPNDSLLEIGEVLQKGVKSNGQNDLPMFKYNYSRPEKWKTTNDVWIYGHLSASWACDNISIESLDQNNMALAFNEYTNYPVISSKLVTGGAKKNNTPGKGYYFYNVLEELDRPGEWYLDIMQHKVYVWPDSDINTSTIEVSMLEQPLISILNLDHVSLQNLTFSSGRGNGTQVENSAFTSIINCEFFNLGLQAVVTKSCKSFKMNNSKVVRTGGGGVTLNGGDRKSLVVANNTIEDCEFSDFSRIYRTYSPAISLSGVGAQVIHNKIHDAPGQAILYTGNNHLIANNRISNVCKEFGDMGAVYTGRDPSSTGTVIENNLFEDINNNVSDLIAAVYIDDGSGGIQVNNNLFFKSGGKTINGFGAVHINGGGNSYFRNNIFIECAKAFSNTPWSDKKWNDMYLKNKSYISRLTKTVNIESNVYQQQYKHLNNFFDSTKITQRTNFVINTIAYKVRKLSSGAGYSQKDFLQTDTNPGFEDIEKHKFQLIKSPDQVKNWQNWKAFDIEKVK